MMVSNIMVINDLSSARRSDGARCSLRVMDGMCSRMAQPSSSCSLSIDPSASSSRCCPEKPGDECYESAPPSPSHHKSTRHPISRAIGNIYSMDDFDVLEMLGEGFFSKVLKVRHRVSRDEMVLKVSKALASSGGTGAAGSRRIAHADAAREADMMRRLRHENVLAFRGVCLERGERGEWDLHLLVDYCRGGSLARLILDRSTHFPWRQRARFALDIANAMEYIHSQRIMHRDLTSMNVLLDDPSPTQSHVVVADFGLSCPFPKRAEKLPQVGTTYFMSPECLKEEFYDEKSDVFSFGVILCQLIARIDADPDSGLHRTGSFGLDYVLFTPCCPPDTPLELLKLAFNSCLLDPVSRPSFASLSKSLRKLTQSIPSSPVLVRDASKEPRLGRSRSDAALKKPRAMALAGRKLSSNLAHCRPVIEGIEDESSLMAMEELARDVARVEPSHAHTNPFMGHERYRKERKIIARVSGRRRSETKPVLEVEQLVNERRERVLRRRCASLPSHMDSHLEEDEDLENDVIDGSPGGIPMAYRDYDMKFIKSMKRFPSRRHTLMPECLAAKSSLELPIINARRSMSRQKKAVNGSEGEGTGSQLPLHNVMVHSAPTFFSTPEPDTILSPVIETSMLRENSPIVTTVLPSSSSTNDDVIVMHQPVSLTSSISSIEADSQISHLTGDSMNNNNGSSKSWPTSPLVDTVIVSDKDYGGSRTGICVSLSSSANISRRNQKCSIV